MSDYSISATVSRMIADNREATRKKGIAELADAAKKMYNDYPPKEADVQITKMLASIESQFLRNSQPLPRRAGVSAVAAVACTVAPRNIGADRIRLVEMICRACIKCFKDSDSTVRVLAVEAMMNTVAHLQGVALKACFADLFNHMLVVASDRDPKVQFACAELSNVVKQVSAENPDEFDMELFVQFVENGLSNYQSSAEAICFVLDWLSIAQTVPGRNVATYLKYFLGLLLNLVSHNLNPVVHGAERTLNGFLKEVKSQKNELDLRELMVEVLKHCGATRSHTREVATGWLLQLLQAGRENMLPIAHQLLRELLKRISDSNLQVLEITRTSLDALADMLQTTANIAQPTANNSFLNSHEAPEEDRSPSPQAATPAGDAEKPAPSPLPTISDVDFGAMIEVLVESLNLPKQSRLELLQWAALVHVLRPDVVRAQFDSLFPSLMSMLPDPDSEVLHRSIEVLSLISGDEKFSHFIGSLLDILEQQKDLLAKSSIIFKRLQMIYMEGAAGSLRQSSLDELVTPNDGGDGGATPRSATPAGYEPEFPVQLQCEKLFLRTAELLQQHPNKRFVATVVVKLTSLLLTADEFLPLRNVLKGGRDDPRARTTFSGLYRCWSFNAVSAIALSLLHRSYSLTYALVENLGGQESSVHTLVQLDRLVQLLESPVLSFVRMALLSPKKNAPLVKALFGIQMVLPQGSPQFKLLQQRMKSVTAVAHIGSEDFLGSSPTCAAPGKGTGPPSSEVEEAAKLEAEYREVQEVLARYEFSNRFHAPE